MGKRWMKGERSHISEDKKKFTFYFFPRLEAKELLGAF